MHCSASVNKIFYYEAENEQILNPRELCMIFLENSEAGRTIVKQVRLQLHEI